MFLLFVVPLYMLVIISRCFAVLSSQLKAIGVGWRVCLDRTSESEELTRRSVQTVLCAFDVSFCVS